jgi:hypothetical protein
MKAMKTVYSAYCLSIQSGEHLIEWMKRTENSSLVLENGLHVYVRKDGAVTHYYKGDEVKVESTDKGYSIFPISKKDCLRHAVGFYIKGTNLADTETIIVNDGSFATYNFRLSPDEMREVVEHQDEIERMKTRWETKT